MALGNYITGSWLKVLRFLCGFPHLSRRPFGFKPIRLYCSHLLCHPGSDSESELHGGGRDPEAPLVRSGFVRHQDALGLEFWWHINNVLHRNGVLFYNCYLIRFFLSRRWLEFKSSGAEQGILRHAGSLGAMFLSLFCDDLLRLNLPLEGLSSALLSAWWL